MRLLQSPNADMKALSIVAPIDKGGTGADNSTEAVQNLGGLNAASLGQANGVAKLNAQGKLDLNVFPPMVTVGPTLNGPTNVFTGQTVQYTITNYDINTTYNISASVGTLTRSGDTLTYTAPGTPGSLTLTVNNNVATVAIQNTTPIAPSITSPVTGSTGLSASVAFTATSFAMNNGTDTHAASDWQIATDSGFTNIVSSTTNDTINKTSWTGTGLSANTTYYTRVRYKGTTYGYGAWSASISFTTKTSFLPTGEEAVLNGLAAYDGFGHSVSITNDGSRVIIGNGATINKAYVFSRSGSTWTQEAVLVNTGNQASDYFGFTVVISGDGTRAAIGAYYATRNGFTNGGLAYVFSRSGSTWTQEKEFIPATQQAQANFGLTLDISDDGTRLIVADAGNYSVRSYIYSRSGTTWTQEALITYGTETNFVKSPCVKFDATAARVAITKANGTNENNTIYIYSRSGTTWTQEAIITYTDAVNTVVNFGNSICLDSTGTRLIVGAYGSNNGKGICYIFVRSGTTWTQEAILKSTVITNSAYNNHTFGCSVSFNSDATIAVIGAQYSYTGNQSTGRVYLFTRSGTTWTENSNWTGSNVTLSNTFYAASVDISSDGTRIIVGAYGKTASGLTSCGSAYIHS